MQRVSPTTEPTAAPDLKPDAACPVCGEPVRGIAAAKPGEHRFVGCDHYASARFLQPRTDPASTAGPLRIGP